MSKAANSTSFPQSPSFLESSYSINIHTINYTTDSVFRLLFAVIEEGAFLRFASFGSVGGGITRETDIK